MSDEHKFGWGLFLFGVVVCVVTALLLPKFVVAALVFAGLCAAAGAYLLDWLSTPLRAIASLIIIIGGLALLGWAVWPALELPRVAITGYDVILFKPYQSTFVNIYFRNVGGPGNITIYSAAGFALATATRRTSNTNWIVLSRKAWPLAVDCRLASSRKRQSGSQ